MKRTVLKRRISGCLLGWACAMALPAAARANAVFASYTHGENEFYNTGVPSTTGLFSVSAPSMTFTFDESVTADNITYAAGQPISATATLSATVAGTVTGTSVLDQPLQDGTLQFKDQFGNNLLTINGFTGDLVGDAGGTDTTLTIDTTLPASPDVGTYSSDFLKFSPPTDVVASISVVLDQNTTFVKGLGGDIGAFAADSSGSFSGNDPPSVPEPSGLCFGGLTAMGVLTRRNRLHTH